MNRLKKLAIPSIMLVMFGAGLMVGAKKNSFKTPQTVLHVITVKWKTDATDAQKQAAIDGVKKMAGEVPGLTSVWLKTLKVQPQDYKAAMVMEFKDKAAFDAYTNNPAHKEWEKIYLPVREESSTHDITN